MCTFQGMSGMHIRSLNTCGHKDLLLLQRERVRSRRFCFVNLWEASSCFERDAFQAYEQSMFSRIISLCIVNRKLCLVECAKIRTSFCFDVKTFASRHDRYPRAVQKKGIHQTFMRMCISPLVYAHSCIESAVSSLTSCSLVRRISWQLCVHADSSLSAEFCAVVQCDRRGAVRPCGGYRVLFREGCLLYDQASCESLRISSLYWHLSQVRERIFCLPPDCCMQTCPAVLALRQFTSCTVALHTQRMYACALRHCITFESL